MHAKGPASSRPLPLEASSIPRTRPRFAYLPDTALPMSAAMRAAALHPVHPPQPPEQPRGLSDMAVAHAAAPQTAHGPCGPCNHDQQDPHSRQVEFQTQDHGPSPFLRCTPMPAREKCFPWIILRTTAGRHPKAASRLKAAHVFAKPSSMVFWPDTGLARWARRYFSCFSSRLGMGRKIWNSMAAAMTMATTVNTLNSTSPVARPTNW